MTTFKYIEVVGTSPDSFEAAIAQAVRDAGHTIHDMSWLEIIEQRCRIEGVTVVEYQVICKIAFKVIRES